MVKKMNKGFGSWPSGWLGAPRYSPAPEYDGPGATRSCEVGLGWGEGGSAKLLGRGGV